MGIYCFISTDLTVFTQHILSEQLVYWYCGYWLTVLETICFFGCPILKGILQSHKGKHKVTDVNSWEKNELTVITECLDCRVEWLQAGLGLKVNKRLFQRPDADNLKLLIPASTECAAKAADISPMSSLLTSGSHCRRISLNRGGCPLFSAWLSVTPADKQTQMHVLYCRAEKTASLLVNICRFLEVLRLNGVEPGQWLAFTRKTWDQSHKSIKNNKTCHEV